MCIMIARIRSNPSIKNICAWAHLYWAAEAIFRSHSLDIAVLETKVNQINQATAR